MFEPLISSRIRRTLLEYILSHSQERFYLRGLARRLSLSISPLRRELKRLEQLGVLTASEEANVRMYTVNPASPHFAQLQSASGQSTMSQPMMSQPVLVRRMRPSPLLATAVSLGVFVIGAMTYLVLTNQRLLAVAQRAVMPAPRQSSGSGQAGVMRGSRWQLLPGSFGGFSSGSNSSQETY